MTELTFDQKLEVLRKKCELILYGINSKSARNKIRSYKKKLIKRSEINYHHVFPKSTHAGMDSNKVPINITIHKKYHSLFENKDPYEILDFLIKECWGDNKNLIKEYIKKNENDL